MVAAAAVKRGDVYLIDLSPTRGREIRKTRPCVVVSPDELNAYLQTYTVALLATGGGREPFRGPGRFGGKAGHVILAQIRTVVRERLVRRRGQLTATTLQKLLGVLQQMFAP